MATIIDALVITLGLDPKGVNTGMQQTKATLDAGVKNIASQIIAPLSMLLAGALTGGAIIKRFMDAADLGKLSQQLNTSVEDLQAWQGAAIAAGGSAEGIIEAAKGLRERTGSRLPITQQLLYAADQLKGLSEMRALEVGKAWGFDEGTIKLLRQGRGAVMDLVNQQREMVAFSKEDVAMMTKLKQAWAAAQSMAYSLGNLVIKLLLPAFQWIGEKITAATGVFPEARKKMGLVSQWIDENGPHIQNAFTVIAAVITTRMIPALLRMAVSALAAVLPFLPFVALVAGLALVFDDLVTYINGGESALDGFWSMFGDGPELAGKLATAWEDLKAVGIALWNDLKGSVASFIGYFAPAIDGIKTIFSGLGNFIVAMFQGNFKEAGAAIRQVFEGVIEFITAMFNGWIKFITDSIKKIIDMIPSVDGLKKAAGGAWDGITDFASGLFGGGKDSVRPEAAGARSTSVQADTRINQITVVTPATDAQGIANDMAGATQDAMNSRNLVNGANSGMYTK